ncbi:hypothetical protein O6H91_08G044600 [Diphasiastrum complanatum]|uniref:Uncharacterized protein n=6 Tax=Diphasiastrum complanatum TaxID=34168 RepID=A0ACC2CXH8_DIPCM|nr:hypothetical protein O6H91_08G044600 [Diphasiastrum complanatum]KAJ7546557.1 hypothetical protein O6H91_08G044600 [Diphasiastrum complanatum]KAJ7546558.1 hypothetical protein O6H91_08G044600 [Diphasiastrum complanatum]KAJ7546559.1 hypothetical protein O6H91_08G044600 [Diphasiastrum complanatum]KAJ7546560.1 hypothetical protein O6H91_08G044600 [Diphasiastrum complanatum]
MEMEMSVSDSISGSWGFPSSRKHVQVRNAGKSLKGSLPYPTHINDIPCPVLSIIFSLVEIIRSRNAMALACREWYILERSTRTTLSLRGNIANLERLPLCFQSVTCLDISNCSPWGYSLFKAQPSVEITAHRVQQAFPNVKELTVYVRDAVDIHIIACIWPNVEILRLIRWHQRAIEPEEAAEAGMELQSLLQRCTHLSCLDLSKFYCWTEDIPPAMMAGLSVSKNLQILNLLKLSPEGFKSGELAVIATACMSLKELYVLCDFDPRFVDSIGDDTLIQLAKNCKLLQVLHLVDANEYGALRGNPEDGFAAEDANITREGLEILFQALPQLQDLALVLAQNVRDAGVALEALALNCRNLTELKLSHFHGLCHGPRLDGLAQCSGLKKLSIKNCVDLSNTAVETIAHGCPYLTKLGLHSCRELTKVGLESCVAHLSKTLVDVEVACCRLLSTDDILSALKPVRASLKRLHIDCLLGNKVSDRGAAKNAAEEDQFEAKFSKSRMDIDSSSNTMGLKMPVPFCTAGLMDQLGDPTGQTITLKFFQNSDNGFENWQHINKNQTSPRLLVPSTSGSDKSSAHDSINSASQVFHLAREVEHVNDLASLGNVAEETISMNEGNVYEITTVQEEDSRCIRSFNWQVERPIGLSCDVDCSSIPSKKDRVHPNVFQNGIACAQEEDSPGGHKHGFERTLEQSNIIETKCWNCLTSLSLWIPVAGDIELLPFVGLGSCPALQEMNIKVEGDCRQFSKPPARAWGLTSFAKYPAIAKLKLDLSDVVGYALSCPGGNLDLSLWERYYLNGIQNLRLTELDYWPPSDKEMNHRGLSLPGAGLLSECSSLRKLFIHGTTYEHLFFMLLRISNLRDVQLREDYYPAPESEMSTEMRVDSCKRFEMSLAKRDFPD